MFNDEIDIISLNIVKQVSSQDKDEASRNGSFLNFVSFDTPCNIKQILYKDHSSVQAAVPQRDDLKLRRIPWNQQEFQDSLHSVNHLINQGKKVFEVEEDKVCLFETPRLNPLDDSINKRKRSIDSIQSSKADDLLFELAHDVEELQVDNTKRQSMLSNFADSQKANFAESIKAKQSSMTCGDVGKKINLSDLDPILRLSVSDSSISFQAKAKSKSRVNSMLVKNDMNQKYRNSKKDLAFNPLQFLSLKKKASQPIKYSYEEQQQVFIRKRVKQRSNLMRKESSKACHNSSIPLIQEAITKPAEIDDENKNPFMTPTQDDAAAIQSNQDKEMDVEIESPQGMAKEHVYFKINHKMKDRTRQTSFKSIPNTYHLSLKTKTQNNYMTLRPRVTPKMYRPLNNRISLQDINSTQKIEESWRRGQGQQSSERFNSLYKSRKSRSSSMNKDLIKQYCCDDDKSAAERPQSLSIEQGQSCYDLNNKIEFYKNRYSAIAANKQNQNNSTNIHYQKKKKTNKSVRWSAFGKKGGAQSGGKYADLLSFVEERESIHKENQRVSWINSEQIEQLKQFYDSC